MALFGLLLLLLFYLLHAPAPPLPELSARAQPATLKVGALERRYVLYAPARREAAPSLLVVFHGSMGSAAEIRAQTGYGFEQLADRHGFLVAYPEGFEGNWNDCRRAADYSARRLDIADDAFFDALVARLQREHNVNPARVFVAGLSNGGQFVLRLALERPERVAGAAVFAASLPTRENSDCSPRGTPPPILFVNGTADPINPFEGGEVSMYGFANRGRVHSAFDSASYFGRRTGAEGPVVSRTTPRAQSDRTWVERWVWRADGRSAVMLLAVHGGGHVVPQAAYRPPRLLGRATSAIDGPTEAWEFFRRQPPSAPWSQ